MTHTTVELTRSSRIKVSLFEHRKEKTDPKDFDSVKIEDWNGNRTTSVSFLVPSGKGEELAAAFRKVLGQ